MFLSRLPAALTHRPARGDLGGIGLLPSDSDRRYFMHRFNGASVSGELLGDLDGGHLQLSPDPVWPCGLRDTEGHTCPCFTTTTSRPVRFFFFLG